MASNNFSSFSSVCVEFFFRSIGSVNEDGKKAIGLDWQNNTFARASRFFVCISL